MLFHYRYNTSFKVIEKSTMPLTGTDVVRSYTDFNIGLFDIYVGSIADDGMLTQYTLRGKQAEDLSDYIVQLEDHMAFVELENDFRLLKLEWGMV